MFTVRLIILLSHRACFFLPALLERVTVRDVFFRGGGGGSPSLRGVESEAMSLRPSILFSGSYSRDKGEAAYSCFSRAIVMDFYDPNVGAFKMPNPPSHNPVHGLQAFWAPYADVGLLGFYSIAESGIFCFPPQLRDTTSLLFVAVQREQKGA